MMNHIPSYSKMLHSQITAGFQPIQAAAHGEPVAGSVQPKTDELERSPTKKAGGKRRLHQWKRRMLALRVSA
jgi:hypothetical protein